MNQLVTAILGIALIGALSAPIAQTTDAPKRIAFVTAQRVLEAHPKGAEIKQLRDAANAELQPIQDQINPLRARVNAGSATANERAQLEVLTRTYQATTQRWQSRINTALEPITRDIDNAVKTTARAANISVVMDRSVAQQTALVVYADEDTDITDLVIERIKVQ